MPIYLGTQKIKNIPFKENYLGNPTGRAGSPIPFLLGFGFAGIEHDVIITSTEIVKVYLGTNVVFVE